MVCVLCAMARGAVIAGHVGIASRQPKSTNVVATHRLLEVEVAALRAASLNAAARYATMRRFVATVSHECPAVGRASQNDQTRSAVYADVAADLVIVLVGAERLTDERFLRAVSGLQWSDHAVERAITHLVSDLREELGIREVPLCRDLRAWADTGFRAVPADLVRVGSEVEGLSEGATMPLAAVAKYIQPSDRAAAKRIRHGARSTHEMVAKVLRSSMAKLAVALGV